MIKRTLGERERRWSVIGLDGGSVPADDRDAIVGAALASGVNWLWLRLDDDLPAWAACLESHQDPAPGIVLDLSSGAEPMVDVQWAVAKFGRQRLNAVVLPVDNDGLMSDVEAARLLPSLTDHVLLTAPTEDYLRDWPMSEVPIAGITANVSVVDTRATEALLPACVELGLGVLVTATISDAVTMALRVPAEDHDRDPGDLALAVVLCHAGVTGCMLPATTVGEAQAWDDWGLPAKRSEIVDAEDALRAAGLLATDQSNEG